MIDRQTRAVLSCWLFSAVLRDASRFRHVDPALKCRAIPSRPLGTLTQFAESRAKPVRSVCFAKPEFSRQA